MVVVNTHCIRDFYIYGIFSIRPLTFSVRVNTCCDKRALKMRRLLLIKRF